MAGSALQKSGRELINALLCKEPGPTAKSE